MEKLWRTACTQLAHLLRNDGWKAILDREPNAAHESAIDEMLRHQLLCSILQVRRGQPERCREVAQGVECARREGRVAKKHSQGECVQQ